MDALRRSLAVRSSARKSIEPIPSRVSRVFAFLGLLIEVSRRDVALDEAMLQRTLAALGQLPALNRVTLSQLVREAERLLDVAHSRRADVGQLSFGPRATTTRSRHTTVRLRLWERFRCDFCRYGQSRWNRSHITFVG